MRRRKYHPIGAYLKANKLNYTFKEFKERNGYLKKLDGSNS
jgi:hypothetical protein